MRSVNLILSFFGVFGRRFILWYSETADFFRFFKIIILSFRSLKYIRFRSLYTITLSQVYFTGIKALNLVVSFALLLGAIVIIQATKNFPKFGIEEFIGNLLVIIIAREVGPLAVAIILISRSGSAIAAEIATQKQNEEIRALQLMGIDTTLYIVFPRVLGTLFAVLSLIVIFDIVAFCGGYILAITTIYIPINTFFQSLIDAFSFQDVFITIIKSVIFGIMIPIICCYYGFKPKSSFQIPIFVSKAVIRTLLIIFVINALISAFFYL